MGARGKAGCMVRQDVNVAEAAYWVCIAYSKSSSSFRKAVLECPIVYGGISISMR